MQRLMLAALCVALGGVPASAQVTDDLVRAAREEGKIVWYTTVADGLTVLTPLAALFKEKYGVAVEYATGSTADNVSKIVNEAKAGVLQSDLWDGSTAYTTIAAADLAGSYLPSSAASLPAELKDPSGRWVAMTLQYYGAAANTELVGTDALPKSYQDLLRPEFKGQMAWSTGGGIISPPGMIGGLVKAMGEDNALAYLEALSTQDVANSAERQTGLLDQVVAGQYKITLVAGTHHVHARQAKGAPITFLKLDPAITLISRVGMLKGSPHPNAARLFLEFILSNEAQSIFAKGGYIPANPNIPPSVPSLAPSTGDFNAVAVSLEEYEARQKEWKAIYERLFQ
ncbi:ABC transporter substrate-binding protein [Sinorhizobium mexicanum]|uniref:Extracellular solute-binding protein n=1 Tax=Sinorhizobium mexicanum TaxID=375549 RepID=A0A859QZ91_9HYPH|nr:extracellular solute-binding protein [Sinorhizobium mexicanum]MBP1888076.1 iron(III) transport system substrate-binding protein [Sinorhizobium mexicanum]QLL65686.1 extracellular solute-binding protein [Sinorhizobium mexicanum]